MRYWLSTWNGQARLYAVTSSLIRKYRQSGMTGLAVSVPTSWAGNLGAKRFGGNACTFRYLLFDKACNTIYFTKLWCFAVELTLRFPWYLASATIRSPYMLFKMSKHEAFSFFFCRWSDILTGLECAHIGQISTHFASLILIYQTPKWPTIDDTIFILMACLL